MGQYKAGLWAKRLLGAIIIAAMTGLSGCSGLGLGLFDSSSGGGTKSSGGTKQEIGEVIWRSRDQQFVRLENQDSMGRTAVTPNAQPVRLSPDQIRAAFAKVEVVTRKGSSPVPVFNEFQLKVLGTAISKALAQARPNQDVTFALVGFHKGGLVEFLKEPKLTTGRVFYDGKQLNLIFGDVQKPQNTGLSTAVGRKDPDPRLNPRIPGMRSFTRRHSWRLTTTPGSGIYRVEGGRRDDWLVFAAKAFSEPPASIQAGSPAAARSAGEYQQLRQELNRLRRDLNNVQRGGQPNPPAAAYPRQPQAAYPNPPAAAYPRQPQAAYPNPPATAYPRQPQAAYPNPPATAYPRQPQAAYPSTSAPTPGTAPGQMDGSGATVEQRLLVLNDLRNKGLISDKEYKQRRQQILSGF